jgi:hypothetical protein
MNKDNPLLIHNSNDHRILVSLFMFRPYSLLSLLYLRPALQDLKM